MNARAPLMVIGAGRGGTSLLAACLHGHPEIFQRFEYRSAEVLLDQEKAGSANVSGSEARLAGFRAACEEDRAAHPDRIWGNKITTEQLAGLEDEPSREGEAVDWIERFADVFHDYRLIFIARHGATCIDSKVRRTGQPIERAARRWCYSVRVYETLAAIDRLSFFCRYEDLVTDPHAVLTRLCAQLNLPFAHSMLEQTESPLIQPEYRTDRFIAEKAAEQPALPPEIAAMIAPWLERLGYR